MVPRPCQMPKKAKNGCKIPPLNKTVHYEFGHRAWKSKEDKSFYNKTLFKAYHELFPSLVFPMFLLLRKQGFS